MGYGLWITESQRGILVRKRKQIMIEKRRFDDKGFEVYLTIHYTL